MMEKRSKGKASKSSSEFYRSKEHSDGFIAEYNIVKMPTKKPKKVGKGKSLSSSK